ncbi:PTS sugar transporter subunit IIA [Kutzneria buriramensis]|uniref:Mannitol-specific phosphotransferase enzyme IIA component n=1 Tax=Kutzneria buriramensis TaxID=1045776 RepID=A0A3E0HK50_9PSEU|nr:PTS sugar transporter subunit IIA [Kutzneria buriramensis]REH46842.1 PTS system mannitol-specific IIA component/phosphocarrier protein FPr [Kutzneria buriramensis]
MLADNGILTTDTVRLGVTARDKADAIDQCGAVLVEVGAVDLPYVAAMHERERTVSTFVGQGTAIPHGSAAARQHVRRTAVAVLQFPHGVDWDGDHVSICVAIAADGDEHSHLLSTLATMLLDERRITELRHARDAASVISSFLPQDVRSDTRPSVSRSRVPPWTGSRSAGTADSACLPHLSR